MKLHNRRKYNKRKTQPKDGRIVALRWFFILFGALIVVKLFFLQVLQGDFYQALASDQHEIYTTLFPERGEIFVQDTSSVAEEPQLYPIATNKEFQTVYAQPRYIDNPEEVAEKLSPILELSVEDLLVRLDKKDDPYEVLKRKVDEQLVQQIRSLDIEGVKFQDETYRFYPEAESSSHLTGFVSNNSENKVGQYGLEGYFEEELAGEGGVITSEKDLYGRWITSTSKFYTPARDGADIVLTIDKNIQYQTCRILKEQADQYQADSAAAIIMNPYTGEIMAMCSYPMFDPNSYNVVESIEAYNNTSIFEAYEPGSIFKPITMAAALDMGIITPNSEYVDTGEVKVNEYTIRNSDKKAHGKVNMITVLEESLNTGMIHVVEKLGVTNFQRYIKNFGFGKETGIQMNTEVRGDISSLDKSGKIYSMTASYGQGITTTPLQMVQAFGAIANGGFLVKPRIIEEIRYDEDTVEKFEDVVISKVLDERTSTLLGGMLVSVVKNGHAGAAGVPGYTIAGKTGTAQIADFTQGGYSNRTNHSFIGYGPIDNPAFVMIVKFEDPKVGTFSASTAAPTFGRIASFLMNYLKVPPDVR